MDEKEFRQLVEREVRKQTTEQEREWLQSSEENLARWRDTLSSIMREIDARLARWKADMLQRQQESLAAAETHPKMRSSLKTQWFAYKADVETQMARTKTFRSHVEQKSLEVKRLIKSRANASTVVQYDYRCGYSDGYNAALAAMQDLIVEGLSPKEAIETCRAHLDTRLHAWRDTPSEAFIAAPRVREKRRA